MSPAAAAYFLQAIAYIADRNPTAAAVIVGKMKALRERPADFPDIGVRGQIPGTRRVVLSPFVLTIRKGKRSVEIAAVCHAKQADAYEPSELLDGAIEGEDDPAEPGH